MFSSSFEHDAEDTAAAAAKVVAEADAFIEEYMHKYMEDDSIHERVLRVIASNTRHTRRYAQRDWERAYERLMRDYFDDNPTWGLNVFRRHFRMRKEQLAYGGPADHYDEYLQVYETTGYECLRHFCRGVIEIFGAHYLRRPTVYDYQQLMEMHEQMHGFPGMIGNLDSMHWTCKNCLVAWKGQFTRSDHGVPTIMLEVVASQDFWI
ncbi:uncharacterized protein LOC131018796 [Salvia miltiorrhiza]|uniref:uncharacterized protein LOC131018796 n=1 Tax=Salvia miltiorrhiza TaxID=226208 RepID=UPI0025AC892F|nr:uncharacterized protein LOC131018796 [Salvia miltiorrhiza]